MGSERIRKLLEHSLESNALTLGGSTHAGLLAGAGVSATPYEMSGASKSMVSLYGTTASTADSNRAIYCNLTLTGAGGGGEALRAYGIGNAAGLTALRGAHISAGLGSSGTITGEIMALKTTLHVPNATLGGTPSGVQAEIYSEGTSSDVSGNLAGFRMTLSGDATGAATLATKAALFAITAGAASGGGDIISPGSSMSTVTGTIRIFVNGAERFIPYYSHQGHS